jgi:hypothetical protein
MGAAPEPPIESVLGDVSSGIASIGGGPSEAQIEEAMRRLDRMSLEDADALADDLEDALLTARVARNESAQALIERSLDRVGTRIDALIEARARLGLAPRGIVPTRPQPSVAQAFTSGPLGWVSIAAAILAMLAFGWTMFGGGGTSKPVVATSTPTAAPSGGTSVKPTYQYRVDPLTLSHSGETAVLLNYSMNVRATSQVVTGGARSYSREEMLQFAWDVQLGCGTYKATFDRLAVDFYTTDARGRPQRCPDAAAPRVRVTMRDAWGRQVERTYSGLQAGSVGEAIAVVQEGDVPVTAAGATASAASTPAATPAVVAQAQPASGGVPVAGLAVGIVALVASGVAGYRVVQQVQQAEEQIQQEGEEEDPCADATAALHAALAARDAARERWTRANASAVQWGERTESARADAERAVAAAGGRSTMTGQATDEEGEYGTEQSRAVLRDPGADGERANAVRIAEGFARAYAEREVQARAAADAAASALRVADEAVRAAEQALEDCARDVQSRGAPGSIDDDQDQDPPAPTHEEYEAIQREEAARRASRGTQDAQPPQAPQSPRQEQAPSAADTDGGRRRMMPYDLEPKDVRDVMRDLGQLPDPSPEPRRQQQNDEMLRTDFGMTDAEKAAEVERGIEQRRAEQERREAIQKQVEDADNEVM